MSALLSSRALERVAALDVVPYGAAGGRGLGERPSGAAGAGTVFEEHRTYFPGDDLRYVDWNAYARLRSLHVKVFEVEETLDVHLLLDCTASMGRGPGSKLLAACRAAAMVGTAALARGDTVRLQTLPSAHGARAFVGRASTSSFLSATAAAAPGARDPLGAALRAAFPELRRRGYGLLITDFLDEPRAWRRAIDFLVHRRVELTCLHVVSAAERDPEVEGPVRLVDAETGEALELEADAATLARYRAAFERRLREVRAYLRSKRARHVLVDASRAGESELLATLLRERVLR